MQEELEVEPLKRRWLSYGLRGLMILVLLCSLPFAWFSRDVVRSQREAAVVERIRAAGGSAWYDYQQNQVCIMGAPVTPEPPGPWWARKLFGKHVYSAITRVDLRGVDHLQPLLPLLPQLSELQVLHLPDVILSPSSVESFEQLEGLESCNLRFAQCASSDLSKLARCDWIDTLTLEGAAASDVTLAVLPSFERLPRLVLRNSPMTNTGLAHIGGIESLQSLEVDRALNINNEGIKQLTRPKHLNTLKLLSTHVTEGCMDSLAKMKSLTTLSIVPGELDLEYYPWGAIRMDNYQSVDDKQLRHHEEETVWVQCIHVYDNRMFFNEDDRLALQGEE